jgi:hypothetical protein
MIQPTNQILFGYWNEVRGERLAPRRFEIEPSRIATILPETFILERVDTEAYPYRLAGTKLCEQFGTEFRGNNYLEGWPEADRVTLARQFAATIAAGGVLILRIEARPDVDPAPAVEFEAILLPLLHTSASVTRLLGSMSALDPPGWLGTRALTRRRLLACDVLWPDGQPHAGDAQRNQAPLMATLAGARLVKMDRRAFRVLDGGLAGGVRDDG